MSPLTSHPLAQGYAPAWASSWGQDEYGPWIAFRVGDLEQSLRWIPPGAFEMGSPEDDSEGFGDERPQHQVRLSHGFWLFDTPCTQGIWEAVMGENPSHFPGANRPVERVRWDDCQTFISRLNDQIPGLALCLPMEAQWEYACRAGTLGARYDEDLDAIAWYEANSGGETHDVAQKRPNAWGLCDMLGNVFEWCYDGPRNYTSGWVVDPVGPIEASADRALRGGFWFQVEQRVRAADRRASVPSYRDPGIGFRCLSSG